MVIISETKKIGDKIRGSQRDQVKIVALGVREGGAGEMVLYEQSARPTPSRLLVHSYTALLHLKQHLLHRPRGLFSRRLPA